MFKFLKAGDTATVRFHMAVWVLLFLVLTIVVGVYKFISGGEHQFIYISLVIFCLSMLTYRAETKFNTMTKKIVRSQRLFGITWEKVFDFKRVSIVINMARTAYFRFPVVFLRDEHDKKKYPIAACFTFGDSCYDLAIDIEHFTDIRYEF